MYLSIASGIVPGQREAHDARRDREVLDLGQGLLGVAQHAEQPCQRQLPAFVVHLQRADTGRQFDDAGRFRLLEPRHQRMHPQPQLEIEDRRPVFDQQIFVAGPPIDHGRRGAARGRRFQQRGVGTITQVIIAAPGISGEHVAALAPA
jgi:hypothetical protein